MSDDDRLRASVDALHSYFLGDSTMSEALTRTAELVQEAVDAVDEVGLTLRVDGRPSTYLFTDPEVPEVDQAQYDTGDGPCLEAFDTGEVVLLASTKTSDRYPRFCAVAAEHGFLSVLALPLEIPQGRLGAMNLYSVDEDAFDPEQIAVAARFAEHASFLLANAQAYWDARSLAQNLEQAMRSRAVIEQAKGIVMAATGGSDEQAFDQLRLQSQYENRKLRDVAADIVRGSRRG